jgi:alkylation response protein AidB-like acyl-CoA dehydrogenase
MGDHFLIKGQKIWTSGAHLADWCFALVRTDTTRKQEGITFILIDMRSPGVDARPIRLISGGSYFCEIFFTDVRAPKDNVVREVNGGWKIGKRLLQFERGGFSSPQGEHNKPIPLSALASQVYLSKDDSGRLTDTDLRHRITKHEMDERAYLLTVNRVTTAGGPSDAASILKNVFSKLAQERDELMIEIMGLRGLGQSGEFFTDAELKAATDFLFNKCLSIAGGTQEIQDNIIAKRILGLPDHLQSAAAPGTA